MAVYLAAACSSNDSGPLGTNSGPAPLVAAPSTPSSSPSTYGGPSAAPVPLSSSGASGPDKDPNATETNFITLVCASDAECLAPHTYCKLWEEPADAGEQLAPELAAASGPAASGPASADLAARDPVDRLPGGEAADAGSVDGSSDAGEWRPIGRCVER